MSARFKNVQWGLPGKDTDPTVPWEVIRTALLMDIRDELQELNATMRCSNTRSIPTTLREIRAAVRRLPVRKRRAK